MLRWCFLIVVVLNLALFAWFEREREMRIQLADRPEGVAEHVGSLTLLSEVSQHLRERSVNNQVLPESIKAAANSVSDSVCIEIKNFPSQQVMLDWQSRLPADVAVLTSDWIPADEYWVYIESPESLQARQELQQTLRQLGLEVSLIQRGQFKGHLSLGRYAERELAVALYEGVLAQGYAARMLAVGTNVDELALWISIPPQLANGLNWLDELLAGTGYLKSEKKVCEGVASDQGRE